MSVGKERLYLHKTKYMERRIKIVWILSLLSALLVIGVQGNWLYTQYQYKADIYANEIIQKILEAGDEEYTIRKEEGGGSFSYSIKRDLEFAQKDSSNVKSRKTVMSFSNGENNKLHDDNFLKELARENMDSLLNQAKESQNGMAAIAKPDSVLMRFSFPNNLSEDSIVIGMSRAFVDKNRPFETALLDSLIRQSLPDIDFHITPWESPDDSAFMQSYGTKTGMPYAPAVQVYYAYNPFQQLGVKVKATIPPMPLFRQMATQLFLSFGLILLLIGCIVFQISTILKQRKIGEMRKHFVNTMIHELKRPVQTLKTFVAFLSDKEMRSDEMMTEQIVQDSMFELDNLSAYLNKLRDMVRADDEMTPLHISRFDLKELIEKVIRLTHIPAGKRVDFSTCFDMESPCIEADPIHVANVLSNLIENAIKYSGDRVVITIEARRREQQLCLTVSDNGIGIPLVEQEKVFAKFYRSSQIPDKTIPGLGLGLSYVKLISEAHHGRVSLDSRLGEGTSITLYLPQ